MQFLEDIPTSQTSQEREEDQLESSQIIKKERRPPPITLVNKELYPTILHLKQDKGSDFLLKLPNISGVLLKLWMPTRQK